MWVDALNKLREGIHLADALWGPELGDGPFPPLVAEIVSSARLFVESVKSQLGPAIAPECEIDFRFSESTGFCPTLHAPDAHSHLIYIPLGFVIRLVGFISPILQHSHDGPTLRLLVSPINRTDTERIVLPASMECLVGESVADWQTLWAHTDHMLRRRSHWTRNAQSIDEVYMDVLLLSTIACTFAIFHEMAHAIEYHLRAKQWVLKNVSPPDPKINLFLKGIEVRADVSATMYMMAVLKGLLGYESPEQHRHLVIALSGLFGSLDVNRRAFSNYDDGDYFPPVARLYGCLEVIDNHLPTNSVDGWRSMCRDTIGEVISALDLFAIAHGSDTPTHSLTLPLSHTCPIADRLSKIMAHRRDALAFAEGFLGIENRVAIQRT